MKQLYEAANSLEAHMVLDLLRQEGIQGRVDGEYLQGAVGALPVNGLVRVMVDESDAPAAERLIDRWARSQPAEPAPMVSQAMLGGWYFAAGLLLGVAACLAVLKPVASRDPIADTALCRPA